jgi:probable phosphoglycerate mutase
MKYIYIARHGQTKENESMIIQGQLDGELSAKGILQVHRLGISLYNEGIELIISGDLGRQKHSSGIVNGYLFTGLEFTQDLRERGAGELQGRKYNEFGIEDELGFDCYGSDGQGIFETFETLQSVRQRARRVRKMVYDSPAERILLMGSGWINSYILNYVLREDLVYHDQDNARVHFIETTNARQVKRYELNKDFGPVQTTD